MANFADCRALKYIELPESLIFIEDSVLDSSGIRSITIPHNVTHIGFGFCVQSDLCHIEFTNANPNINIGRGFC